MEFSILTRNDFQSLLFHFCNDLSFWPMAEPEAAKDFLKSLDEARDLLEAVIEMDESLATIPPAPKGLATRILNTALGSRLVKPKS